MNNIQKEEFIGGMTQTTKVLRSIPVVSPDTETIYATQVMGHNFCIAVEDAEKVRDRIVAALNEGKKVIVSFKDGEDFTSAYLGEAIGRLYSIFPEELVEESVRVTDMEPIEAEHLEYTLEEVKEYLKNPERWDAAALATFGEDYFD